VKEFDRTQWRREESIGQVGANSVPPTPYPQRVRTSKAPVDAGAFFCVPSMIESLEVEVLYPA
jgi:hypothetical protein